MGLLALAMVMLAVVHIPQAVTALLIRILVMPVALSTILIKPELLRQQIGNMITQENAAVALKKIAAAH